ncbi:cell division protein FtsL [Thiohalocapsa halophila]|jgi:cell division protein FtsL|uniref:Cell division protein FtsL n=1 Tax=Thiohalocapsa halophila TaxID=69359 RepID=A0ABS1CKY3_9GAMM|nr:cell division protein FtsL [Thiohalocapsa halophila]MBK1632560.1 cell division protein FtsL [Thiohalocapsa halophila]NBC14838.1 cell division protein FtsL [Gammaproteobacteria bacterium]
MSRQQGSGGARAGLVVALMLAAAVLASGVAVIHVKYLTREEFGTLQQVRAERDALDVEWGRLQIQEAALTSHTRIEDNARTQLDMIMPAGGEVRVVEVAVPEADDAL